MSNIADRLFAAKAELESAEDALHEDLKKILGHVDWTSLTVDHYDYSFEAFEFIPFDIAPTPEQLAAIGRLGFEQFWIHSIDTRTDDRSTERYFGTSAGKEAK